MPNVDQKKLPQPSSEKLAAAINKYLVPAYMRQLDAAKETEKGA